VSILEMVRRLVAATDETLFGATEFALRDHGRAGAVRLFRRVRRYRR
jgi:hypothetical protein